MIKRNQESKVFKYNKSVSYLRRICNIVRSHLPITTLLLILALSLDQARSAEKFWDKVLSYMIMSLKIIVKFHGINCMSSLILWNPWLILPYTISLVNSKACQSFEL